MSAHKWLHQQSVADIPGGGNDQASDQTGGNDN